MDGLGFFGSIIIGILAGAISGWLMKGRGFGFIKNLIIGLIGSVVGGWVYSLLGVESSGSTWGILVMSVIGAVVLLFIISLFNKKK